MHSLQNTYNAADLLEVGTRIRGYTREEETEYRSFISAGKMMSILKLQARLFLQRQAA